VNETHSGSGHIFHITGASHWQAAQRSGSYQLSTHGQTFQEVGFIHCSCAHQVAGVANAFYADLQDLVLLVIDPTRLAARLRLEPTVPGGEPFPHIYGPLNLDAVVEVRPYSPSPHGTFGPPSQ
jgi:uncharacterized protein (DUF952 family)